MIGQTISHYKILEKLGEGGMGVVYKAQDTKLNRLVALKFLAAELTRDEKAKTRFIKEAQAASALDHANIAVVHEINETSDGLSFICMAYYEGQTLKEQIEAGPLAPDRVVHLALQIAEGLHRAHEAGIVHCDIKPGNVIITQHGEVKILDFGIAKLIGQSLQTTTGRTAGTLAYMSPEQAQGMDVDRRSDLFSLGVMLYEMVTGKRPFVTEHDAALLYLLVTLDPVTPSQINPEVPAELDRIILRLLDKQPDKRYQSASELSSDLKQFVGIPEEKRETRLRLAPGVFKHAALGISAVAIIGLVLVSILTRDSLIRLLGFDAVPEEKYLAVLPFTNVGSDPATQPLCDGLVEILTSKLTQLQTGQESFWVVAASEVRQRQIASASEAQRAFGITMAVTGSVQREDSKTRIAVNVVDARTARQLRSFVFEERTASFSRLQDDVTLRLVEMLDIHLSPELMTTLTAGGTADSKAYELYMRARGYLYRYERIENTIAAIELFKEAARLDSLYVLAYAGLGEAYWRRYEATQDIQWVDNALRSCAKALQLNDQLPVVHLTRGIVYRGTGKYEEAVQEFQHVLAKDPVNTEALRELARSYEGLNDLEKAEATYKKAIELQPGNWAGHNMLGVFYVRHGRLADAVEKFKKVVVLTPDNVRGYNNLGGIYFQLKRLDESRKTFERSLSVEPNYIAYSNLGTLSFFEGRYAESAQLYEKALAMQGTDYRVWGYLASAYRWSSGEGKKAEETFRKAVAMAEAQRTVNPRDADLLCTLAGYHASIGDSSEARALLHQASALAPENVRIMGRVGMVYEELGDREQALKLLATALKQGFPSIEIDRNPVMKKLKTDARYQQLVK